MIVENLFEIDLFEAISLENRWDISEKIKLGLEAKIKRKIPNRCKEKQLDGGTIWK